MRPEIPTSPGDYSRSRRRKEADFWSGLAPSPPPFKKLICKPLWFQAQILSLGSATSPHPAGQLLCCSNFPVAPVGSPHYAGQFLCCSVCPPTEPTTVRTDLMVSVLSMSLNIWGFGSFFLIHPANAGGGLSRRLRHTMPSRDACQNSCQESFPFREFGLHPTVVSRTMILRTRWKYGDTRTPLLRYYECD